MRRHQLFKKLRRLSVVMVSAYVMTGCPSPTVSQLVTNGGGAHHAVAQEAVAQESALQETPQSGSQLAALDYEVCAAVESWQRPTEAVQAKRLGADARYREALQTGSLKVAATRFWDHSVVSFTTYGLSARMEPENLSGVWTAIDEMTNCYSLENTVAINEGNRAETWLLNQRISSLEWQGDRYVMTVEPALSGLQVIQFDRTEKLASLPLEVVSLGGDSISVISGDWQ
ncbi:MAG: hypothetical protein AAF703_13895 [Cyanobacteria bacterium P01_D01_bin.105]